MTWKIFNIYLISAIWVKIMNHSVLKKTVCKFKIKTPKTIWIDEFVGLRSKTYSFKCNDKNTNKFKGFSKSQKKVLNLKEFLMVYLEENSNLNVIVS